MSIAPCSPQIAEMEALHAEVRRLTQKLHETNVQLACAQRAAPMGVWSWSIDTDLIQLSEAARLILGLPVGRQACSFAEVLCRVHPQDRPGLLRSGQRMERGQRSCDCSCRIDGADGTLHFIRAECEAEFDERGTMVRLFGTVFDLTEHQQLAASSQDIGEYTETQRVADLSRRLTQTLENTPEAFVAFDPAWRFTYVNHHAEALLGKPREHLLGTNWFESFPLMKDSVIHQRLAQAMSEFRTIQFEERSPHSGRWFQLTAYPSVDGIAVSSRDVSDEVAVRRELEGSQERYRRLFETSVDAIFQTAPDGTIEAANQAACEMFGRTEAEFRKIGRSGAVDTTDPRLAILLQQRESMGSANGQLTMVRADGTKFEADVTSAKYTGSDGRVYSNVFVRDATQRVLAQERLAHWNTELAEQIRKRTADLEAANEQLRSFAYSVAHDLRSPIAAVTAFAEELQRSLNDRCSDRERRFLERIRVAGVRMDEFVEGMLALATVSRTELTPEEVDLAAIAREIISDLKVRDPARQFHFSTVERAVVSGDRRLLCMALQNLLSNAWKFTRERPIAEIRFECHRVAGEAVYSVTDNGAGFDMAYADKLFAPFQRLHSYSEFPGTGIGLSNVQRIVLRHGGRVWAQGKVGEGTTIFFTLPSC